MTELVQQRNRYDCVPCCLAMLTHLPYSDVLAMLGDMVVPDKGVYSETAALVALGFDKRNFMHLNREAMQPECSPKQFRNYAWKRKALVSVPSLNIEGGFHMVFYDGRNLYDPAGSYGKIYAYFEDLQPTELVIFDEYQPQQE